MNKIIYLTITYFIFLLITSFTFIINNNNITIIILAKTIYILYDNIEYLSQSFHGELMFAIEELKVEDFCNAKYYKPQLILFFVFFFFNFNFPWFFLRSSQFVNYTRDVAWLQESEAFVLGQPNNYPQAQQPPKK